MATRAMIADTTVKLLAPYDPRRLTLAIYNNGTNTAFISKDPTEVTANGWPIPAPGAIAFTKRDGDEPEGPWYVQTLGGTTDLRIVEGFSTATPGSAEAT